MCDWVVPLMLGHLNRLSVLACQYVELAIAFISDVLGSNHGSHFGIVLILSQLFALVGVVVVHVEEVVGRSALVLFAGVKLLNFCCQYLILVGLITLHTLKAFDLSL